MKKTYTLLLALMMTSLGFGQIISQYIETNSGSTPKGIEIWNNTGATLDFATNNLEIEKGSNGGTPSLDYTLSSGTLASGDVIVIGTADLEAITLTNGSAFFFEGFTFNGDDSLVVKYGGTVTDTFGEPGTGDPGSNWNGSGVATNNQNIELNSGITTGDLVGWTDPSIRFSTVNTNPSGASGDEGFGLAPAGVSSDTEVLFTGTSASVSEGIGTFELEFTILNEDAAATSFDVVLTSGDNTDIDGYVTESVTFPGGSVADQVVELTITDDAIFEADETFTFEIQNVTGGSNAAAGTNNSFDLTITNNDVPPTLALPYTEDFSDCSAAQWVPYDQNASSFWTCGSGAYTMNSFPNTDDIDWLISNFSIDFDLTINENIAVTTSEEFGDDINDFEEFELRYSTDYAGYGDPTGATWTALTFDPNNTSTGFGASAESITVVDASGITGVAYLAFYYDAGAGSGPEEWNVHNVLVQVGAFPTSVELTSTSASVAEDSVSYDLDFAITNEDATNPTTFDVVLTSGDAADIDSYTTQLVTFPAGSSANQTVTVTITDDILEELDEVFTFEIQNVAGGLTAAVGTNTTFNLTILENDEAVIPGTLYDADLSNDGDGFPAHSSSSPPVAGPTSVGPFGTAPNAWSLSYDTTPGTDGSDNFFEVIGGELISNDWGGQGVFTSQVIDVTGINVVDITAAGVNAGANENNFTYFYILDGGTRVETPITSSNGNPVNYSELSLNVSGATSLEVGFEFSENGSNDGYDISEFLVIEGSSDTSVQFASTSNSVFENAGTYDLTFEITFEDAINDTTFDVVLISGDAADINSYTTQTVTFPAGTSADQTVTVTITDDLVEESTEIFTFEIQNVAGGSSAVVGINNSFDLTILDEDGDVPLPGDIVISEIMYNSTGADDEWIEIYNASGADITLDSDWRLNYGSSNYDFTGTVIPANSYITIALGSNGDTIYNIDNPFTPDVSVFGTPAADISMANQLVNSTATIALIFEPSGANTTIDSVTYDDGAPWPTAADGNGPSLELIDVAFDNSLAASWVASGLYDGGTPGAEYVAPITYTFNGTWSPSDPNGTATAGDDIVIESGNAIIASNTTCNSVIVNPGAGLTIDTGINLTATNGLSLESSSTSYSSLILDGTVTGTMSYDRHVNINGTGTTGSNDLVSAPLTGQAFNVFATANPNILNNGTVYLFGPFEKNTGQYVNWAATETTTLDAGVGYRTGTTDNSTVTFTGTAENGTITNDIINGGTNNEEWNLVGNPYPSYLHIFDFLSHDIGGSGTVNIQLFDTPTAAIYGYDGSALNGWTLYNLANAGSNLIAPGQGFIISANAALTAGFDLEFTPDMRRTGSSDDFIAGRNAELVYVKLGLSTSNDVYGTEIYFNSNASTGLDLGYDAGIWNESTPDFAIYSHLVENNSGIAMALQAVNSTDISNVSIPLGVNANQGVQLRFSIVDMTLPTSVNVYLEDVVKNTVTLLNNSDYVITPDSALSGTGRFFLRTSENALTTKENNLDNLTIFALNSSKELIVSGETQDNTVLNLFDIQGRNVKSIQLDDTSLENRIDVSTISGGVYIVTIQNDTNQITQKVVIN